MPKSGTQAAKEGVVEEVTGRIKEAAGAVTGDERRKLEGQAQRKRAEADRDVAKREVEAERARARAEIFETEERLQQKSRE